MIHHSVSLPQILPLVHQSGRRLALVILLCAPFLFGLLALALGQDANWDLRNYHWYNAYAFVNGRYGLDLLPSQTPYFYNPTLDVPFFLLASTVSAKVAAFILGSVQGLNFVLLFMLAYAVLVIQNSRHKVIVAAALAALGMVGGGGIAQLGTVFYDNITSLGIFLSALLVIRFVPSFQTKTVAKAMGLAAFAGLFSGMMMGLKLPSVIFCVGLCGAMLVLPVTPWRRILLALGFGLGVLLGIAVTYGHWGWFLLQNFGSPLFPYFNNFFQSPLAPLSSARDTQFLPNGWMERLLFPFIFSANPKEVGEIYWQDWRIAILYALLPLALLLRLLIRRGQSLAEIAVPFSTIYLLVASGISYIVWLLMFAIYRYLLPLEMLAPLLIVLAAGFLPNSTKTRRYFAAGLLLLIAITMQGGDWTRQRPWLDKTVAADVPPLGDTRDLMILMAGFEPYSHLVTVFPPEIPFVRIQSNFSSPDENKGINTVIAARLAAHEGRFKLLIPPWQHDLADQALRHFKLQLMPQTCQKVVDKLYDDYQPELCDVARLKDMSR